MKLFLLTWPDQKNENFDQYIGAIVVADTAAEAKKIHPNGKAKWVKQFSNSDGYWSIPDPAWTEDIQAVKVKTLGDAWPNVGPGVIMSSFHEAG